jgi:hypothetical protein
MFFKSPYHGEGETPVHDLFKQEQLLLNWAREKSTKVKSVHGHTTASKNGKHAVAPGGE